MNRNCPFCTDRDQADPPVQICEPCDKARRVHHRFFVIGPGYYGRGDTVEEAMHNYKAAGGSKRDKKTLYEFPPELTGARFNGYGVAWSDLGQSDKQPDRKDI